MKRISFCFLFLVLVLTACNLSYFQDAEYGEFVWDPTLAIPLGELEYDVTELFQELDDGTAQIGPGENNVVTIVYEENIKSQDANSFLEILDQNFDNRLLSGTDVTNSPVEQVIRVEDTFEFEIRTQGNEEYDSIYFESGNFNVEYLSSIGYEVTFEATIESLVDGSAFVVQNGSIDSNGETNTSTLLDGLKGFLYLDKAGNISRNKFLFTLEYEFTIPVGGDLSNADGVEFQIGIRNSTYTDLFGDVGTQELEIDLRSVELNFFRLFTGGEIRFADPRVDFFYDNSFGFPLGVDYSNISALAKDGTRIPLTGSINDQLSIVDGPLLEQKGQVLNTQHRIDVNNSNVAEIFSSQPSSFRVAIRSVSNPANGPVQYNFVNEFNELDALARIEIPLDMAIDELIANESFDFKNAEDLEQATRALMRVIATNEMPMGGDLELQFLNGAGEVFYTIDERPVFTAAPIGPDGKTTGSTELISEVQLEDEDLRQMEQAARINIRARLNSTDVEQGADVKFFDEYILHMQIALLTDLQITTSTE